MHVIRCAVLCWMTSELLVGALPAAASECSALLSEQVPYHTDFETGRVIRTGPLSLHPDGADRIYLYGKAHVLALGQRCIPGPEENVLTLYEPDGRVRWSLGMKELLPGRTYLQRGAYRWLVAVRRQGSDIEKDASLLLVLQNYDELQVRVRDGAVKLRSVPVSELGDDPVKLKARALYLGRSNDRVGQQALLRKVLAQNPRDYEATTSLAMSLSLSKQHLQAAALWRQLETLLPLPELSSPPPTLTEMRYQQATCLKDAESYPAALALITERLQAGVEDQRLWHMQAELQLALGRGPDAKASFDTEIALIARRILATSDLTLQAWPEGYYEAIDYAGQSLEIAGHTALGSALRQHPAAQAEIIAEFRERALRSQDRNYANLLGRIYVGADTQGDFREAIEWYTFAAGRPGNRDTEAELALCHLHRHSGGRPDFAMALRYCDAGGERGDASARFWAGMLRLAGLGTPRDEEAGLDLLASAVTDNKYQTLLTQSLPFQRRSFGTFEDFHWAARVLEPYAANGNVMVQRILRQMEASNLWRIR